MTGPSNSPRPPDGDAASVPVEESRARVSSQDENGEREGIELTEYPTHEDDWAAMSSASHSSGEEYRITTRTRSRTSQRTASVKEAKGILGFVRRFWTRHVVLTVPEKSNRDHFGTLAYRSPAASINVANAPRSTPNSRYNNRISQVLC